MGAVRTAAPLLGFKPHLRVEQVPGEAVYLISEQRVTALHGEQVARIAPFLTAPATLSASPRTPRTPSRPDRRHGWCPG